LTRKLKNLSKIEEIAKKQQKYIKALKIDKNRQKSRNRQFSSKTEEITKNTLKKGVYF